MLADQSFNIFALVLPLQVVTAGNVLILGDSLAEFAGKSVEDFCKGATSNNAGISGTTAKHWLSSEALPLIGTEQCGGTPDYIWLSIGGNDVLNLGCDQNEDALAAKLNASIEAVQAKAPSATLLMTGYCLPADVPPGGLQSECNTPEKLSRMMPYLKKVVEGKGATFVDSANACGGSSTSWSSKKYFQDPIHLNNRGYCKVFTQAGVQTALGCQEASYDCDSVTSNIRGLDQTCSLLPASLLALEHLDTTGPSRSRKQLRGGRLPHGFVAASLMELSQGAVVETNGTFASDDIIQINAKVTRHMEL